MGQGDDDGGDELDRREALVAAREAALTERMDAAEEILTAADERDVDADARDTAAVERENTLDREDFVSGGADYGRRWPERIAAGLDREYSKEDRTASHEDRLALTEDQDEPEGATDQSPA